MNLTHHFLRATAYVPMHSPFSAAPEKPPHFAETASSKRGHGCTSQSRVWVRRI